MIRFVNDPALLAESRLITAFCVRQDAVRGLLAALAAPGARLCVSGPRGSGRSMLLLRLAPELRRVGGVALLRAPIVPDLGGLWLEVLDALGLELPPPSGDRAEQALARLQAGHSRFTLLIDDADALSAAARSALDALDAPWLRVITATRGPWSGLLSPLSPAEVARLWLEVRGEPLQPSRAAVIAAISGGCPRLVAQWASQPAEELRGRLLGVIDANADRFQAMIAEITADDTRRVFLELAALRGPCSARQVAERARFEVNKTSTLLGRLVAEGRVQIVDDGKVRTYRVSERLLSLYVHLRRFGDAAVAPLFAFGEALAEPRKATPQSAGALGWEDRGLPLGVPPRLLPRRRSEPWLREVLGEVIPHESFSVAELPKKLRKLSKEPEVLLPLLERDGSWAQAGAVAMLRAWRKGERSLAGRLARALAPWLEATDPLRVACAVALVRIGEHALALQVVSPEVADERAGRLRGVLAALLGRPVVLPTGDAPLDGVLAVLLLDHPEHRAAALSALESVVQANPAQGFLRSELGRALLDAGRGAEAVERLLRHPAPEPEHFALAFEGLRQGEAAADVARAWAEAFPGRESAAALAQTGGAAPTPESIPRLADPSYVAENLAEALLMSIELARAGHERALLDALASSAALLQPLLVALRRRLGEPAGAPLEVEDLADELQRRISSRG